MVVKRERVKRFLGVYQRISNKRPRVNGKPDVCYEITYKDTKGKKVWERVGWTSEGITAGYAAQLRAERVRETRLGGEVISIQKRRNQAITFGDLAEKYIEWAKSNKKDWSHDEGRYQNHIKAELSDKLLEGISPLDLERLKKKLQKKDLSPATVKHCLVIIRQMLNKAKVWGFFTGENPIRKIRLPKLNNRRQRFLSYEEADELLEEMEKRDRATHDQALISLHCGLRFGEIAALTWADINFIHDIMYVRSKSGEKREAYLTREIKTILESRKSLEVKASDIIFPGSGGQSLKAVSSVFSTSVKHLGLNEGIIDRSQRVVFHTLRHTFASWLALEGSTLLEIKELLGHKTTLMTERYSHLIPDRKRAAVMKVARAFGRARRNRATSKKIRKLNKSSK